MALNQIVLASSDFADDHPTIYEECRELIEIMDEVPGIQALKQGQFFLGPAGTGVSAVVTRQHLQLVCVQAPPPDLLLIPSC